MRFFCERKRKGSNDAAASVNEMLLIVQTFFFSSDGGGISYEAFIPVLFILAHCGLDKRIERSMGTGKLKERAATERPREFSSASRRRRWRHVSPSLVFFRPLSSFNTSHLSLPSFPPL